MKILVIFIFLILLSSCASSPQPPKGEWQYVALESFFENATEASIKEAKRRSRLTCQNESYQIRIPSGAYDSEKPSNDAGFGSHYEYYSNLIEARDSKQKAERERFQYFVNCMELKGFKRTWIEFEKESKD